MGCHLKKRRGALRVLLLHRKIEEERERRKAQGKGCWAIVRGERKRGGVLLYLTLVERREKARARACAQKPKDRRRAPGVAQDRPR